MSLEGLRVELRDVGRREGGREGGLREGEQEALRLGALDGLRLMEGRWEGGKLLVGTAEGL